MVENFGGGHGGRVFIQRLWRKKNLEGIVKYHYLWGRRAGMCGII
jgi:hypothetical protein